jgi:hypothetical protein
MPPMRCDRLVSLSGRFGALKILVPGSGRGSKYDVAIERTAGATASLAARLPGRSVRSAGPRTKPGTSAAAASSWLCAGTARSPAARPAISRSIATGSTQPGLCAARVPASRPAERRLSGSEFRQSGAGLSGAVQSGISEPQLSNPGLSGERLSASARVSEYGRPARTADATDGVTGASGWHSQHRPCRSARPVCGTAEAAGPIARDARPALW